MNRHACVGGFVAAGIVLIVAIIILSQSFIGVHYYEYGFLKTLSTGDIFPDPVYEGGLYSVGPNKGFLTFPSDAHFVELDKLDVASGDENTVHIWVDFQYRLRKDELNLLREQYNTGYEPIMKSSAQEALKQTTTRFTNRQMLRDRDDFENALADAIRGKLESTCCSPTCPDSGYCKSGCKQHDKCTEADMKQHIEILGVQLTDLDLPQDLRDRYLKSILLDVEEEKTQLDKNVTIIAKATDVLVNQIKIEGKEIAQNASAQAKLLRDKAIAGAREIIEAARIDGLKSLFSELGITSKDDKDAINYLRKLKEMDKARFSVNFDTLFRQT